MRKYGLILILFLLGGCLENKNPDVINGESMGTYYSVNVLGDMRVNQELIDKRLVEINEIFSTWQEGSELSKLNNAPVGSWVSVSNELHRLLNTSIELYHETGGYFDPGIGRLIDLWGFGAKGGRTEAPQRDEITKAFSQSSIQYLIIEPKQVKKTKDIHINLSAIAKGYAVDEIARLVRDSGVNDFLVEIGGEIIASGTNNGSDWTVGVESPDNEAPTALQLINASIATSGSYRNFFIWEGKKYMHIFDPTTGFPANNDLVSVSVIHPQSAMSDAYATAMMAMGSDKAIELAKKLQLSVLLMVIKEDNIEIIKVNLP